jgi:hypothetical protein
MTWTCSNIHEKEGNSTKSGVLKWLCLFFKTNLHSIHFFMLSRVSETTVRK